MWGRVACTRLDRQRVLFSLGSCDLIQWEQKLPHLQNANGGDLFLYPGFILYRAAREAFSVIDFHDLTGNAVLVKFHVGQGVPTDSTVIGQTWAKCNKDGSRDRRFVNNYQIPIALYSSWTLKSNTGLWEEFHFSNPERLQRFVEALKAFVILNIVIVLAIYCGLHLLYLVWTSKSIVYRCICGLGIACIVLVAYSTLKTSIELQRQQADIERGQVQDVLNQVRQVENERLWNSLGTDRQQREYRAGLVWDEDMTLEQYAQTFIKTGPDVFGLHKTDPKEAALFDKYERMRLRASSGLLVETGSESKEDPYGKLLTFERYKQLVDEKQKLTDTHK
jgi:hypothetical protein